MKNISILIILLVLCLFLCACGSSAAAPEPTNPVVATEPSPTEPTMLTQEELVSLSKWMPISLLKQVIEDPPYAETLIGNLYRFDGIVYSVEADYAIVQFSLKDRLSLFEPEIETVAAEIYLSADELASVVLGQKVVFVGRFDDFSSKNGAKRIVFYNAAIEHDRFENFGEIKELNTGFEPNTWNVQFAGSDIKPITFVPTITGPNGNSYYFSYKEIDGRYVDGYFLGPNGALVAFNPILLNWPDIIAMQYPRLSQSQIQAMIDEDLTLDEVAEAIDTLADLIQYLYQKGYVFGNTDLNLWYGGYEWAANRSARQVFEDNIGNCGGGSHLVNYILRNDFDEQGYFRYAFNVGGHVTNYFKQDGLYYFFDLAMISNHGYINEWGDVLFCVDDPQEYANSIERDRNTYYSPYDKSYVLLLWMYPHEDDAIPVGINSAARTRLGVRFFNVLPKQYEDRIRILYLDEGMADPIFIEAPEKHLWPEEVQ